MTEYITIGHLAEQLTKYEYLDTARLTGTITEALLDGDIEPMDLLEVLHQLSGIGTQFEYLPSWLYTEIGSRELFIDYLKKAGFDPTKSDDFIHLYSDEYGDWYANISDYI